MASRPDSVKPFAAGEHVEVVDATSKHCGATGIVQFFVDDNIYVKFPGRRWSAAKMFFPEQLRVALPLPQTRRR